MAFVRAGCGRLILPLASGWPFEGCIAGHLVA
jgi:hypothetical protein